MEIIGGIAVTIIALYWLTRPSQEEMDRSAELRAQAKAERKAELKKFRQEHNTPFWWIMRILVFGGFIYLIFFGGLADLTLSWQ